MEHRRHCRCARARLRSRACVCVCGCPRSTARRLFTIGLYELHPDGRPILNAHRQPIATYDNTNIMSFARVWTGFERRGFRPNLEATDGRDSSNMVDPSQLRPSWRDVFPSALPALGTRTSGGGCLPLALIL